MRERWSKTIAAIEVTAIGLFAAMPCAIPQPRMHLRQMMDTQCKAEPGRVVECVRPSDTDPRIQRFDDPNYILYSIRAKADADLLVFMTGTGSEPPGPRDFLEEAANAGYRVISLAYNDRPAVAVYCPSNPDPACSENFRRMRIYGAPTLNDSAIENTAPEAIVNRLVKLLQYLDHRYPGQGWARYLDNGGSLNWQRIAFAGQSQGAGMAALIAKEHEAARIILFSSPWDFINVNGERKLASWLSMPSKTPPDRWFGGYHARENMADLLAQAYVALKIPSEHIRIFTGDLPPGFHGRSRNPFHGQGIRNPAYAEQREFFLGHSP